MAKKDSLGKGLGSIFAENALDNDTQISLPIIEIVPNSRVSALLTKPSVNWRIPSPSTVCCNRCSSVR